MEIEKEEGEESEKEGEGDNEDDRYGEASRHIYTCEGIKENTGVGGAQGKNGIKKKDPCP